MLFGQAAALEIVQLVVAFQMPSLGQILGLGKMCVMLSVRLTRRADGSLPVSLSISLTSFVKPQILALVSLLPASLNLDSV